MLEIPISAKVLPVLVAGWMMIVSPIELPIVSPTKIHIFNDDRGYDYIAQTEINESIITTNIDEYGILTITVKKRGRVVSYTRPDIYKITERDLDENHKQTDNYGEFQSGITQHDKAVVDRQIQLIKNEISKRGGDK